MRSALAMMTYPPQAASVRASRHFVVGVLEASGRAAMADDVGLVVSELAANAVLHARTDFDVVIYEVDGGVRVSIRDRSPALPVLVAPSASSMSGRGLALVERLVSRWGAGPSTSSSVGGKSVWFEVDDGPAGAPVPDVADLSVEELLAAWSDDVTEIATVITARQDEDGVDVVLPALDAVELLAAKERLDDVLRELQLVLLAGSPVASARGLAVARRLDEAARAFDDVRRQVRRQVSHAVATGGERVALELHLPPGTGERAAAYRAAVEAAEELAEVEGSLLSVAATLARHRAVRRAYLDEIIAATRA
ncbi:Histidine kinase-like ATPase domain-containing protein [Quadrisphaera granulorum]|uniref:Histidine kinase-like protein n=1 Tax=Quadrisphaera granulorum TaxID=317664 RepID=A0A315ZRD8_9ACTN|nr:histidine kinase-like protein [Quadrisphaera granulorum]SZE98626.1 Histidine kinase-like ATPase domain-containing protein [Quadrisphaera granulorum]